MSVLRLGTRGSLLALTQSRQVKAALEANGHAVELEIIRTAGDGQLDMPIHELSGQGLFTRELDEALLSGRVHLAVHSHKDLPPVLPDGLCLAAVPTRVDSRDVVVGPEGERTTLASLEGGAVVGTSSLRRMALLRAFRHDLSPRMIRGNVDTRLRKLDEGQFDAISLAGAGLMRLGFEGRVTEWLECASWPPAPGQGALGIVTNAEDTDAVDIVGALNDPTSAAAVAAERAFLESLGGGCQVPIGAFGMPYDLKLRLSGMVASPDGTRMARGDLTGDGAAPEDLGRRLADLLRSRGAEGILAPLRAMESKEDGPVGVSL